MPLFTSASGFQINGGTFIDNAGDLTIIHTAQTVTPEQNISSPEFVMEGPSRELSGVERNDRGFGAMRTLPYATFVASSPSFSNSPPFTFAPQGNKFNSQHFLGSFSAPHTSQDFTGGYQEPFHNSISSMGSEHPLSSFAHITGSLGDFSKVSPSDNQLGLTSTELGPIPLFSTQLFSEEMQPQCTPSFNLQLLAGPFGEPTPSVIASVAGTCHQPWDDQPQRQRDLQIFLQVKLLNELTIALCHPGFFMADKQS
ncbi:hypothetical protein B0H13DRAFT_2511111 [Mycena leptocephala]|nr:hypothetical protein B0H13DRAFT_2511111 [Mycena leptocephala]